VEEPRIGHAADLEMQGRWPRSFIWIALLATRDAGLASPQSDPGMVCLPSRGRDCGGSGQGKAISNAGGQCRETMTKILPVIMCGGSGSRMWPDSRESLPKQFIPLIGERSTFQSIVSVVGDPAVFDSPVVSHPTKIALGRNGDKSNPTIGRKGVRDPSDHPWAADAISPHSPDDVLI
jgi:hypothetical protein